MIRTAALAAALCLHLAAAPCRAQNAPATIPTRDVDITYAMTGLDGAGKPVQLTQRTRWSAALGKLRVDPPGGGTYMVVDYRTHHLLAVRPQAHAVLEMPADTASVAPGLAHAGSFRRLGDATVAGLPCTEWFTEDSGGQPTAVCLTADGVLLRARNGQRVLVQAQSVSFAPVGPETFAVPEDFHRVNPQ